MYETGAQHVYTDNANAKMGEASRRVPSHEEADQVEKMLIHLRARVEELRERLDPVLMPSRPTETSLADKNPILLASGLTMRLRQYKEVAQHTQEMVADILDRLDV